MEFAVPPETLEQIHNEVINRIKPILSEVWPTEVPIQNFDIAFSSTGTALSVQYQSDRELGKVSQDILTRSCFITF